MKKLISVVLSGAMLASVFLCGCNTKPSETETEETTIEATTTVAETEPEAHIDPDKLKAVTDYYESKITDDHSLLSVYMDGVRGGCDYYISDGRFYFSYDSFQGESQLTLSIDTYTESVDVSIMEEAMTVSLSSILSKRLLTILFRRIPLQSTFMKRMPIQIMWIR